MLGSRPWMFRFAQLRRFLGSKSAAVPEFHEIYTGPYNRPITWMKCASVISLGSVLFLSPFVVLSVARGPIVVEAPIPLPIGPADPSNPQPQPFYLSFTPMLLGVGVFATVLASAQVFHIFVRRYVLSMSISPLFRTNRPGHPWSVSPDAIVRLRMLNFAGGHNLIDVPLRSLRPGLIVGDRIQTLECEDLRHQLIVQYDSADMDAPMTAVMHHIRDRPQ